MPGYLENVISGFVIEDIGLLGRLNSVTDFRPEPYELCRFLLQNKTTNREHIVRFNQHLSSKLSQMDKSDFERRKAQFTTSETVFSNLEYISSRLVEINSDNSIVQTDNQKRRLIRIKEKISLRDYQEECVEELIRGFSDKNNHSQLLILPTGAGKTRTAMEAITRWIDGHDGQPHVLWVAHSKPLCNQAEHSFESVWGQHRDVNRHSELWMNIVYEGGIVPVPSLYDDGRPSFTISTPDSIDSWKDKPPCNFDLIVIDEAHHGIGEQQDRIFCLPHERKLGLTATPDLAANRPLFATTYTIPVHPKAYVGSPDWKLARQKMIKDGILSDFNIESKIMAHEVAKLGLMGGFAIDSRWSDQPEAIEVIVKSCLELIENGSNRIIIFCDQVEQCNVISTVLRSNGIRADSVHGKTDSKTRESIFTEFNSGLTKVIVSVDVLREGVDLPGTDAIMIIRNARSTRRYSRDQDAQSHPMFNQMVGRGLRGPSTPGGTKFCQVLHFN